MKSQAAKALAKLRVDQVHARVRNARRRRVAGAAALTGGADADLDGAGVERRGPHTITVTIDPGLPENAVAGIVLYERTG